MAERQPSLTDMFTIVPRTAHVGTTVSLPAASGSLVTWLHALLAHTKHAVQVPSTHGVVATVLAHPDLLTTHAVVLVTELTTLTHTVIVTQTLWKNTFN